MDFLRLLLAYSPITSAVCESSGSVGPLACAARKGNAEDLNLLMHSVFCTSDEGVANDRVIDHSISGSNPAAHDVLVPSMPSDWVHEVDSRGRGPLHWVLEYPSAHLKEMVERLLRDGVDVFRRDKDGNSPEDVARICDDRPDKCCCTIYRNLRAYFETLISSGFDVELDEDGDLWWPSHVDEGTEHIGIWPDFREYNQAFITYSSHI